MEGSVYELVLERIVQDSMMRMKISDRSFTGGLEIWMEEP